VSEEKSREKKRDWSNAWAAIIPIAVLAPIGYGVWTDFGAHVYGSTPEDLAKVTLGAPKQLARALKNTSIDDHGTTVRVVVKLKTSAGKEYEKVTFTYDKSDLAAPNQIDIDAEHESENGAEAVAALARQLHALRSGSYTWNKTSFRVSSRRGDVTFKIDGTHRGNPLFDRQLEAGRELALNAAFGTAIDVSTREIADTVGGGYPVADVAKLDLSVAIEDADDAVRKLFPGAASARRDSFAVALDHPLFGVLHLDWTNQPRGRLSSIGLDTTDAYKDSRALLATCLGQKIGAPKENTVDYAAGKTNLTFTIGSITWTLRSSSTSMSGPYAAASVAQLFTALDACRDAREAATTTHGEKR